MERKEIKIGLNIPAFIGSLISLILGLTLGLTGVWKFIAVKEPVPQLLKVMHGHTSWWSVVILIFALLLPSLPLKKIIKKFIILFSFVFIPLYALSLLLYYSLGKQFFLLASLAFVLEVIFFAIILIISLISFGLRLPKWLSDQPEKEESSYNLFSNVSIPSKVVGFATLFLLISIITGWYLLFNFELKEKAIEPAALVQLHTHVGFFAIAFMMVFMAVNAVEENIKFNSPGFWLGLIGLITTFLGLLVFNFLNTHSIVWVLPAMIFYLFYILGLIYIIRSRVNYLNKPYFSFVKGALIFIWLVLLGLIAVGPYLSLKYDTSPNITVTYKQPEGMPYPGPYPQKIIGTAPVKHTPRGLENLHLSPGSWSHVAIFWLIILLIFGEKIFTTIEKPNLIFLFSILIVQAPFFNAIGRIGAWADLPGGPGPLFLIAQPLKVLNILLWLSVLIMYLTKIKSSK